MNRTQLTYLAVGIFGLAGVLFWVFRTPSNNENFPTGTWWLCQNPTCKNEFVMTMKQLSDHHAKHYGEPIPCPKCGETKTVRAQKCWNCGTVYPLHREVEPCPKCKKMPKPPADET